MGLYLSCEIYASLARSACSNPNAPIDDSGVFLILARIDYLRACVQGSYAISGEHDSEKGDLNNGRLPDRRASHRRPSGYAVPRRLVSRGQLKLKDLITPSFEKRLVFFAQSDERRVLFP